MADSRLLDDDSLASFSNDTVGRSSCVSDRSDIQGRHLCTPMVLRQIRFVAVERKLRMWNMFHHRKLVGAFRNSWAYLWWYDRRWIRHRRLKSSDQLWVHACTGVSPCDEGRHGGMKSSVELQKIWDFQYRLGQSFNSTCTWSATFRALTNYCGGRGKFGAKALKVIICNLH